MTEEELAALEALIGQATPGPWDMQGHVLFDHTGCIVLVGDADHADWHANVELVADGRDALPRLIAEVRRLRAALGEKRREVKRPREWSDLSDWEKLFAPGSLDW